MIALGVTIGILGAGQLARMLALAAARLGFRVRVYAPEADPPAADVVVAHHRASYTDLGALARFADCCAAVTCEFESVPASALRFLASLIPVSPRPALQTIAQDRWLEKRFLQRLGIPSPSFAMVSNAATLNAAYARLASGEAILKSRRFGYDGKGQAIIRGDGDLQAAWTSVQRYHKGGFILESRIAFRSELAVTVARGFDGTLVVYAPTETHHRDHVLARTRVPARIPPTHRRSDPRA